MVSNFFLSYRLAHTFTYNRWQNCWDTRLKRGNFWEQNNPHPSPQGWGVQVATLFSTGCSNSGTILLHGGSGGEKASISFLKPATRYPGYQRFFLSCDEELSPGVGRRPTCLRPETAHEKSLAPRVAKRQEGPLAVFRANCLNLSLRAVVLLKITPSSTGYTYSVASDNCWRLCPHTDGSCAGKRSLSDRAYVYTWERYFDLEKRSSPAYRIGFCASLWRMVFNWPHAHWSGKSGDKV